MYTRNCIFFFAQDPLFPLSFTLDDNHNTFSCYCQRKIFLPLELHNNLLKLYELSLRCCVKKQQRPFFFECNSTYCHYTSSIAWLLYSCKKSLYNTKSFQSHFIVLYQSRRYRLVREGLYCSRTLLEFPWGHLRSAVAAILLWKPPSLLVYFWCLRPPFFDDFSLGSEFTSNYRVGSYVTRTVTWGN